MATSRADAWRNALDGEIRRRVEVLGFCVNDPLMAALVRRAVLDPTVDSLLCFARDWAWTFDPRLAGMKDVPFLLWPEQEALLRALHDHEEGRRNLFIDKSRDTGVTWLVCVYYVWRWLTVPGWVGSIGSRKAELLDRLGDSKSVFAKVRHIIDRLPAFLRPRGYNARKHSTWARVINPANGATITGEAGRDMGRGGRSSVYFLDEFGKMPDALAVEAAVSGNTNVVVYATTATAPGTRAYEQRHRGTLDVFELGYESDPRIEPGFLERMIEDYGPEIVAREYQRNWSAMDAVSFIPLAWVRAAVNANLEEAPNAPRISGFDVADGGGAESVHVLRHGGTVVGIDVWSDGDVTSGARRTYHRAKENVSTEVRVDSIGVGAGAVGTIREAANGSSMNVVGVNVAKPPSRRRYADDGEQNEARHRFANLKAELWWQLRLRFQRTHEWARGEGVYEPGEMISIPNDPALISQLVQPRIEYTSDNRVRVESKESLAKRGVRSPDRAEALMLAFGELDTVLDWSSIMAGAPGLAPDGGRALPTQARRRLF
jgi:phage terminase large subunit